jgi:DNA-binding transcriptional LysR family regulator
MACAWVFDRIGRRTVLTEAGRAFLPALRILAEAEQASPAAQPAAGPGGQAASGHHPAHRSVLSQARAGRFCTPVSGIDLTVDFKTSAETHKLLCQGELELGFMSEPPLHEQALDYVAVLEERLCFAVAGQHPLALLDS